MDKKEYIKQLANFLVSNGTTITGKNLADHLNWNQFKTGYDTEYKGTRGTYKLIEATSYKWLVSIGQQIDADNVAMAFMKPDGTYAYKK